MPSFGASGISPAVFNVTDEQGVILGTAFCVNIIDSARSGTFLLTAGHAVRLAWRARVPVRLISAEGRSWPGVVLGCNEGRYPDVGLIYAGERVAEPVACAAAVNAAGPVTIRGCPAGVVTQQANIRGHMFGIEKIETDDYLDIALPDLSLVERSTEGNESSEMRSRVFPILRGFSGAPVVVGGEDNAALVTGLVVRRNTRGIANRVYAVPVQSAVAYLSEIHFTLRIQRRRLTSSLLTGALVGQLMVRSLRSDAGMHELWEDISSLFYQGLPMDDLLRSIIEHPTDFGLGERLTVSELEFLLARLVQKRGRHREAMRLFRSAAAGAAAGRTPGHQSLAALVRLRELGGSSFSPPSNQRRVLFEQAIGQYEELPDIPEDERAYEVASVLGVEAANLSNSESFLSGEDRSRRYFLEMTEKHESLLSEFPDVLLEKQEVVQLMLQLSVILWGLRGDAGLAGRSEEISHLAARGSRAALQRTNGIFYCQMMIAQAVAERMRGDNQSAFFLVGLAAHALADSGLTLDHEGLRTLGGYIKTADPLLSELLSAVSLRGAVPGSSLIIDGPYEMSRVERSALLEARSHLLEITMAVSGVGDLLRSHF
jgi:hypothetical protein